MPDNPKLFIFLKLQDTFKKYTLLIAFQPVISALSGNVGLQTMATITQGLPLGLFHGRRMGQGMGHEMRAGVLVAGLLSFMLAAIALLWYSPMAPGHSWGGSLAFGMAIFFAQFCSSISASVTASFAPLLFNRCDWNPAEWGGPFETAFQDVVGSSVMLAGSAAILAQFGDYVEDCPGGDVKECVMLCKAGASYDEQCLQHCLDLALRGLC